MAIDSDAVVVGAGPNGLSAGITLAEAGRSVLVVEARDTVGGGCRSAELTLPGFVHDVCSAVHPLAASSPLFRRLPLAGHGLELLQPEIPVAHPLDDGTAVALLRSVEDTAADLGTDAGSYRRLLDPLVGGWEDVAAQILDPVRLPRRPVLLGRFATRAVRSARWLAEGTFEGERTRALVAGLAGHAILPLDRPVTAGFALVMGASAHAVGWPVARGGSQAVADALASHLRSLGGGIETGWPVASLEDLPRSRVVLLDVAPRHLADIAGDRLPEGDRRKLRAFWHGPGAFKVDLALDGPVPWAAEGCREAGTVHLGGTFEEIAEAEEQVARGEHPDRPFVLLAQPGVVDVTRAPEGRHTVWAYCHVPPGSTVDMSERIEAQIERFAPGFRDRILARSKLSPADLARYNANYVGGDIAGGAQGGLHTVARPFLRTNPYATADPGIFLCSASTPPGPGVHGMCGHLAARAALRHRR
ncbi:MAG: phytoene desaturase family protein [Actinomycetota bacterium]